MTLRCCGATEAIRDVPGLPRYETLDAGKPLHGLPALKTVSNNWNSNSTRNLFNNSYLRMKNITLSYNFPQPLIKKISLNSLQLFVQADNLLTFSKNQGLDPEQGITGLTYYRYPAMRSISGGLNVSF